MPVDHSWRAAVSAVHLLHRASRVADAVFGRLVGSALTPRQFVVLATVAENEGINQMAIMAATGIDRSSVAELVQRLVKLRLVQRRRTRRDARAYSVRPTEARNLSKRLHPTKTSLASTTRRLTSRRGATLYGFRR